MAYHGGIDHDQDQHAKPRHGHWRGQLGDNPHPGS
jgi:hypothetical protein